MTAGTEAGDADRIRALERALAEMAERLDEVERERDLIARRAARQSDEIVHLTGRLMAEAPDRPELRLRIEVLEAEIARLRLGPMARLMKRLGARLGQGRGRG
jgi:septal ring factor EnvC (AmiA/AmiB activator)